MHLALGLSQSIVKGSAGVAVSLRVNLERIDQMTNVMWHMSWVCTTFGTNKNVIVATQASLQRGGLDKFWNKQFLLFLTFCLRAFFSDVGVHSVSLAELTLYFRLWEEGAWVFS